MQFIGWHFIFTATGLMLRPLSVGLKGSRVPADYFSLEVFVNPLNTGRGFWGAVARLAMEQG